MNRRRERERKASERGRGEGEKEEMTHRKKDNKKQDKEEKIKTI